jgi:uncharacterized protein YdeI (YjbR/CyaY-like superfamily)
LAGELDPKLTKSFQAVLEATGTSLHWVIARVPIDLKSVWPMWKSRRVFGDINGFAFRTALMPGPKGASFTLIVNKRMQVGAGVRAGDTVRIKLAPDLGRLVIEMPAELAKILNGDRALKRFFDGISPSMRKGFTNIIADAKTKSKREKRAEAIAESLMSAMEGEIEPPPTLRVAFQRLPDATRGWRLMTPIQRRNHLLGIFYPQTIEGREKRAAKAVEQCFAVAKRHSATG